MCRHHHNFTSKTGCTTTLLLALHQRHELLRESRLAGWLGHWVWNLERLVLSKVIAEYGASARYLNHI